jgi:lipid A 3-O-deacylase
MKRLSAFFACMLYCCLPLYGSSLSFIIDNDVLLDSDNAYTGGMLINWMSDEYSSPDASGFTRRYIEGYHDLLTPLSAPGIDRDHRNASISLHQTIITPEEVNSTTPNYNGLPYVGILSLAFSYYAWDPDAFDEYRFLVGTIGPNAGAESTLKFVHDVTGHHAPQGWDNQMGNALFAGVGYMHGRKLWQRPIGGTMVFELFDSYNVDLGNHYAGANGGIDFRVGSNIPSAFYNAGTLLGISHSRHLYDTPKPHKTGWSLHGGVCLNLIGYMKIIEDAKNLGYTIDDDPLFLSGSAGADLYIHRWQLSFDFFSSPLYTGKHSSGSWNRLTLTHYF